MKIQDKVIAAQQEFKKTVEYAISSAKFVEAEKLGFKGARMYNHVKEEFKAEQVKMKEIAGKYGVSTEDMWEWSIY